MSAERQAYLGPDVRHWLPDVLTGLLLISCGLYSAQRLGNRCGVLLVLGGVLWFLPNFASVEGVVGSVAGQALYAHRGPLVHLLLAFPTGRLASWTLRLAAAVGYVIAVVPGVWASGWGTVLTVAGLGAAMGISVRRSPGRYRQARLLSVQVAAAVGLVLVGTVSVRQLGSAEAMAYPSLFAYESVLAASAVVLVAGLRAGTWDRSAVTDLVLDRGDPHGASLRDALAWALGDPSLQITYSPEEEGGASAAQERTLVEGDGVALTALTHRPGLLTEPGLRVAVMAAVRLGAEHASLQRELQGQVDAIASSRRRLLTAADEEGARLERRLAEGPMRRLTELEGLVSDPLLQGALTDSIASLRALAHGLHPRVLADEGLAEALQELAGRTPVAVAVDVPADRLPPAVEIAAYFVCSEALANIVKHARADAAEVTLAMSDGAARIEIADDGVGGAAVGAGSGLQGLADRLEALGGTLAVDSPPGGGGTRVVAVIPTAVHGTQT